MYGGHDPAVCGGMFAGRASAIMGLAGRVGALGRGGGHAGAFTRPSVLARTRLDLPCCFRPGPRRSTMRPRINADEATTIAREQGFRLMLGWCLAVSGWAAVQRGDAGPGRGVDRRGDRDHAGNGIGSVPFLPHGVAGGGIPRRRSARRGPPGHARRLCRGRQHRRALLRGGAPPPPWRSAACHGRGRCRRPRWRCGRRWTSRPGKGRTSSRCAQRFGSSSLAGGGDGTRDLLVVARGTLPRTSGLPEASEADALLAAAPERT